MKKIDFDNFEYDLEDVDTDIADMVRSLSFRKRPTNNRYRFIDDERPAKRKKSHRQARHPDQDIRSRHLDPDTWI